MSGVTMLTVKKWEKLNGSNIPADVQDLMHFLEARFDEGVEATLSALVSVIEDEGGNRDAVEITYYRSQDDYSIAGVDESPFGDENAMSRAVAARLKDGGIRVAFVYPEEKVTGR